MAVDTIAPLRAQKRHHLAEARAAIERNDARGYERAMTAVADVDDELDAAVTRRDAALNALLPQDSRPPADVRNPGDATRGMSQNNLPGRELNGIWPTFGEFVRDLMPRNVARKGAPPAYNNLVENDDASGEYLVPAEHASELMKLSVQGSIVRPRATIMPMTSDSLSVPRVTETDRSGGAVHGGLTANWSAEAATISATDPVFGEVPLTAWKLAIRTQISNELFNDSVPAVNVLLRTMFSDAVRFAEDSAFLTGAGAGRPLGALHASNPALITVNRATSNQIGWADVTGMVARLLPSSMGKAAWLANHSTIPQLFGMTVGTGENPIWVQSGSPAAPLTILGMPLIFTEHLSALGTAGDFALVDFSHYLVGDRQRFTIRVSEHEKFSDDMTVIRGTMRLDGRPWPSGPLTPANGGATVSPFVRLGDPA